MPIIFSVSYKLKGDIKERTTEMIANSYLSSTQYPEGFYLWVSLRIIMRFGIFQRVDCIAIYIIAHKSSYRHRATHFPYK